MTDAWKVIPGWEGYYEASDQGQIRSVDRYVATRWGGSDLRPGRILKPCLTWDGYPSVKLAREGKAVTRKVHLLVLLAFTGERPPGMQVCHNDGVKRNNTLSNLRWDTASANAQDSKRQGLNFVEKTHCIRGHEFTEANTYRQPARGTRVCMTCRNARARDRRRREAAGFYAERGDL